MMQVDAIRWLLKHEADPRASDSEGYLPMHYAASEGHLQALKAIIEEGMCDAGIKTFQVGAAFPPVGSVSRGLSSRVPIAHLCGRTYATLSFRLAA